MISGTISTNGLPVLCDSAGRIIPWNEIEECYQALRTFHEQCTPEEIAKYNERALEELPPETAWEAWRRQRREYRPGMIYLLQDTLGTLQPMPGDLQDWAHHRA